MEYKGTYKKKHIIACTEKEYWDNLSLNDRYQDDRFYLVDKKQLIYKCQVYGYLDDNGYIKEISDKIRYERPENYWSDLQKMLVINLEARKEKTETHSTTSQSGKKTEEASVTLEETSKNVDEYLASKKSVDFFFEEINKKEAL